MPAPVLPGIFRGIVSVADPYTRAGRWSTTLDFYPTQGGSTDLGDLATALASIVESFFEVPAPTTSLSVMAYLHDDVPLTGHQVEVFELDGPNSPSAIQPFELTVTAGTREPLPAEVALCLTKRTGGRGRRFRGRSYLGSLGEPANVNARPQATFLTTALESANTFLTGTEQPGELNFVVASAGNGSTVPATASLITSWTADDAWDSQRRRGF